jgi:hypothetical protein
MCKYRGTSITLQFLKQYQEANEVKYSTLNIDQVNQRSKEHLLQLNCKSTKEMVISFSHPHLPHFWPSFIDGNHIVKTTSAKVFELIMKNKLTRTDHEELAKSARKLYFLLQLKRAQVPSEDLVLYYCACIRSSLDYMYASFSQLSTNLSYFLGNLMLIQGHLEEYLHY